jgi:histidinol-phosphate aminotransferase
VKKPFKSHILDLNRYQTSKGRNLATGLRLDRNERVDDLEAGILEDIWKNLPGYCLAASPEADSLYRSIADNLGVAVDQIFISTGITEGIRVLYDFCCNPGDNVVCLDPTYPMYSVYAKMYDVEYRPLTYNVQTFLPQIELLEQLIDSRTRFLFLPNPNLPIESCFSLGELEKLASQCEANNTFLVIDEAYHYFGAPASIDLIKNHDNVIVFRTFSKAYGLAGLRLGFMLSDEENISYFNRSRSIVESNSISMSVAEYMLKHPKLMLDHVAAVKAGADFLKARLDNMGFKWWGGDVTNGMIIFLDRVDAVENLVRVLREQQIYIRGGFEAPFDQCVRVSLGNVEKMKLLADALSSWRLSRDE